MTRPLSAAQLRIIESADPVTGRIRGTPAQLAALERRGLAFRHPRPPHGHYLTPAGRGPRESGGADAHGLLRESEDAPDPEGPARRDPSPARVEREVFTVRAGGEPDLPAEVTPSRLDEVRDAWRGLLEMRRLSRADGSSALPCPWERAHLVEAAALALEAAGHAPAPAEEGTGYRVRRTPQPEAVAVHVAPVTELNRCAVTLERAGWQVGEHGDPRTRRRYLLASPRRA
ncbi:hypothetical protein [Streptomyces sp. HSG2]|uniref:hypothetical protein n=1 Tax=Streptomyces sp. HSG2 TaxID=2797167 RepID=UPI0019066D1D|nr:hypothetical protein [Streptomyces sp. HSG2]